MEAKDTVMNDEELDDCYFNPPTTLANEFQDFRAVNRHIARAQTEISYKAGIREVVEWLKEYAIHGGKVPLHLVLDDIETHSPFGKPN